MLASIPIVPQAARTASNCAASSTPSTLTHPPPFRIRKASGPPSYNTKQSRGRCVVRYSGTLQRLALAVRCVPDWSRLCQRTALLALKSVERGPQEGRQNSDEKETGYSGQLRPRVSFVRLAHGTRCGHHCTVVNKLRAVINETIFVRKK